MAIIKRKNQIDIDLANLQAQVNEKLSIVNNLSDIQSKSVARDNLEIISETEVTQAIANAKLGVSLFYQIPDETTKESTKSIMNPGDRLMILDDEGDGWAIYTLVESSTPNQYELIKIQSKATMDMDISAPAIKASYESNPNTNAFTDLHKQAIEIFESDFSNKADIKYVDEEIDQVIEVLETVIHEAPENSKRYVRMDKTWVGLPFDVITEEGKFIATKTGWKELDDYDLKVGEITSSLTLPIETLGYWTVMMTGSSIVVTVPDYPKENRAKTLVFVVHGNQGSLDFQGNVNWGIDGPPVLSPGYTTITALWDPVGIQWIFTTASFGINLDHSALE